MTLFKILLLSCGLNIRGAASFLKVSPDTIKSWSCGRNKAPDRIINQLAKFYKAQCLQAEKICVGSLSDFKNKDYDNFLKIAVERYIISCHDDHGQSV